MKHNHIIVLIDSTCICVTELAPKDSFQMAQCESLTEGVQDLLVKMAEFYFCKDEQKKVGFTQYCKSLFTVLKSTIHLCCIY